MATGAGDVHYQFVAGHWRFAIVCIVWAACLLVAVMAIHQLGAVLVLAYARNRLPAYLFRSDGRFARLHCRLSVSWEGVQQVWQWGPAMALGVRELPSQWVFADEIAARDFAAIARQARLRLPAQPVGFSISR